MSTLLSERLQTVAENHNISEKIVCLTADNTNSNFGGAERRGPNNVFKKLQNSLGRNIVGVGCTAHVIHNCIEHACEALPVDVEAVVNKIYSYFFRYTVRVTELKQFCDFVETEYRKVKGYAATRWLSLMPSIQRILEIYNALKSYFQSQDKCPVILKSFFEDPMGEVWLWFIHYQSCLFETTIKEIEGEGVSASEAAVKFMNLKEALENRKASVFLPWKVKELLRTQENSEIITSDFKKLANVFYTECVTYLEKWEKCYQDMMLLRWTLLETELLRWEDVESSFQFVQPIMGVGLSIDNDSLFDEFCYLTKLVTKEKIGEWQNRKCDVATKWIEVFRTFEEKNVPCKNLSRTVEFSLCLPGTNAPVERVFSLINNLWTSEKTQLGVNTLKSILICQVNFEETCCEMYTKLSKNVDVLKKIHASEKYRSQNDAATATATCENP